MLMQQTNFAKNETHRGLCQGNSLKMQKRSDTNLCSEMENSVNLLTLQNVCDKVKGLDAATHELEVGQILDGAQVVLSGTVVCIDEEQ